MTKRIIDIIIAIIMFGFGVWVFVVADSIRLGNVIGVVGPKFFPQILAAIIMFMSLLLGIQSFLNRQQQSSEPMETKPSSDATSKSFLRNPTVRAITLVFLISVYTVALDLLGYRIASFFFIGSLLLFKGMRSPLWLAVTSITLLMALYVLFYVLLSIPLPVGSLTNLR